MEVYGGYVWSTVWILNQIKNSIPNQEASHSRVEDPKLVNVVCCKRKQWYLRWAKEDKWASWPGLASGSPKSPPYLTEEEEIIAEPWVAVTPDYVHDQRAPTGPQHLGVPAMPWLSAAGLTGAQRRDKIRNQASLLSRMDVPAESLLTSFKFPQCQYLS